MNTYVLELLQNITRNQKIIHLIKQCYVPSENLKNYRWAINTFDEDSSTGKTYAMYLINLTEYFNFIGNF